MSAGQLLLNRRGQSIVELVLVTPLLLVGFYVAMDFGLMFFTTHLAQNAVREAARIGVVMPDCAVPGVAAPCVGTVSQSCYGATNAVVQEACNRLPQSLTGASVSVTLTGVYYPATCMREVQVTATGNYNYGLYRVIALFGMPVPANPVLQRTAAGRYQGQSIYVTGAC